ncbi:hypothetical protein J6590_080309 [Homalodisca vitripennis]|nr:hypothetical protein J6590_080309 [Homalodisca vitripennis]
MIYRVEVREKSFYKAANPQNLSPNSWPQQRWAPSQTCQTDQIYDFGAQCRTHRKWLQELKKGGGQSEHSSVTKPFISFSSSVGSMRFETCGLKRSTAMVGTSTSLEWTFPSPSSSKYSGINLIGMRKAMVQCEKIGLELAPEQSTSKK